MNNKEAQENELIALESIYDKDFLCINRSKAYPSGSFLAHPVLPDSYCVKYEDEELDKSGATKYTSFNVNYLPPITLEFQLHDAYPSQRNPAFLLTCHWLTQDQLESLCKHLDQLWRDGQNEVVLYIWMQFLQKEVLNHLGIQDSLILRNLSDFEENFHKHKDESHDFASEQNFYKKQFDERLHKYGEPSHPSSCYKQLNYLQAENIQHCDIARKVQYFSPSIYHGYSRFDCRALSLFLEARPCLIRCLKGYNEKKVKETYDNEWFTCDVCMEEKQGKYFMRFSECQHMFCQSCMKSYFETRINDGSVTSLICPKDKCTTQPLPSQVCELVGPELYARYDSLLLTAVLDTMSDVIYCPRNFCQCAVLLEPDEPMAICPSCNYVFCIYCKRVYHGMACCRFKSEERKQIREEYLRSSKEEKELMQKRYGHRTLQMLVDETLSEEWLQAYSKKCPDCNAPIQKFDGCNEINCLHCGSYFCWLCMVKLETANPYDHFNMPNSTCYNKLLLGIEFEDNEDWEV